MNNTKTLIINLIKSFFVTFAWMNIGNLESTSILLLCVFGASYLILSNENVFISQNKKNERVSSCILGALFVVLYALYADLTGGLENKLFVAIYVLFTAAGLFVMFSSLLHILLNRACDLNAKKNLSSRPFDKKMFWVYAVIIFVCCLPFLALNFPGVMTPDSLNQLFQIQGIDPLSNHHPWMHTLLIGAFYKVGYALTGNVYVAIAFYTVFQVIMVSVSIAYALVCVYEMGVERKLTHALLIAFIILPYNLMYAVTIWKDILFTMAVLIFTVTIIRIMKSDSTRDRVLFVISGFAMCVFRHNGFYAFIATVVVWLFVMRKSLRKYLVYSIIIVVTVLVCRGPLMSACGFEESEYVFNLHIPLQQVGRVIVENGNISDSQIQWLENINSLDFIRAAYSNQGADTMTSWVLAGNNDYFVSHKVEFFKLWASVGMNNPMAYVDAFLDITMGYWAPMKPQQTVFFGITQNDMGLEAQPIIGGFALIKINELLTKFYEMIPVYGFMYCMGGYFWILIILGAVCINNGQYKKLIAFLPVFMLTLTILIATPLAADIRYAYPLMVVLPFLMIYTLIINNDLQEESENVSTDIC